MIDPQSATWLHVKAKLLEDIEQFTDKLVGKNREDLDCDKLRGKIRYAQEILGWVADSEGEDA